MNNQKKKQRPWRVHSVEPIGLGTWELTLEPEQHSGLTYKAGQFVWLNVGNNPFSLHENPFSISSAPGIGSLLQFVIKELGDFTRTIGLTKPGTKAYVDGSHGNLIISDRAEPGIALIAGGVGIAPLLSILRQMRHENERRPAILVYGNRVEEQILYREELDLLAHEHGSKVVYTLSEPPKNWAGHVGPVDRSLIQSVFDFPQAHSWLFVLCGPPAMMAGVEDTLIELGVPAHQILSESFKYD